MKRNEQDPNDTEDLGLSRSQLRDLEAAQRVRHDLDRFQREVGIVQDAQRSLGFDASQGDTIAGAQANIASLDPDEARVDPHEARLSLDEAKVSLDDMRANLADFRPGLFRNIVPTASEMLKRQAESVRASTYRPPSLLHENAVKGLAKPPIPPSSISQILDTGSRLQGMLSALPERARSSYPRPTPFSAITKSLGASTGFSIGETPKLLSKLSGIERNQNPCK